eukprot:CAMPEP_0198265924 /NCGR_PEP_ID=MMETSP1447-20131203/25571_1 /TAXON_ID=420782 /ORGANISM="Chaetoceros dichaeta, Strain CCMP1751" /LENGTH=436 /DNA_ID=CAMNT_0043955703 /DNA_START=19 /DNA_END=1329 /DNA_ORIENTATION=+
MAALTRPTEATYVMHERVTINTTDREEHSFCGIMFPIKCKDILPINQVVINSISVRGGLGPITVWVTNDETTVIGTAASIAHRHPTNAKKRSSRSSVFAPTAEMRNQTGKISLKPEHWTQIYSNTHNPSFGKNFTPLDITSNPIILKPNQVRGVYIHSTLDSDEAIVYDNQQKEKTHDDTFLTVLPGRAHVSSTPFRSSWGYGGAWRNHREFVGKISYGVVYKLWNPIEYRNFGGKFRTTVRTMFACQRRRESPLSRLPDDVIYYILNMCRWDWVGDGYEDCLEHKKRCRKVSNEKSVAMLTDGDGGKKESAGVARAVSGTSSRGGGDASSCGQSNQSSTSTKDNDDADDSDSDSDMDTTYDHGDHSSGNTFSFRNVDALADSDEENTAAEDRSRMEGRRRSWLTNNHRFLFQQLLGGMQNQYMADCDDDDDDESD